jgi:peptide/nickel transport system substrate-binding protein
MNSNDQSEVNASERLDTSVWDREISRRTVLLGGAALLAAPWLLGSCGQTTSSTSASSATAQVPKGGTLRIARPLLTSPKSESLDPASPFNCYSYLGALYNRLVKQGEDGTIQPDLATHWEGSPDMMTWTLIMRDGVTFHDGKPFTSADAAYTLRHILDPKTSSVQAGTLSPFMKASGISTPDAKTLVVKLESPNAEFVSLLMSYNCYVIPDGSAKTIGMSGVGTGPFKLASFVPGGAGKVSANADYFGGAPKLDAIEFSAIGEQQARVNALLAGQVDFIDQTNLDYATAKIVTADSKLTTTLTKNCLIYELAMLCDTAPFTDAKVRQAFKMAYQPQGILDLVMHGAGTVANNNPVLPTDPYYLDYKLAPDPEKAKALLASAGFTASQQLYTSATDSVLTPMALAYQNSVKAAGLVIDIQNVAADSYWSDIWMKKPFFATWWSTARPIDQLLNQVYRSGSAWNETRWSNPTFAATLDNARKEPDQQKRKQFYQDAQKLLIDDSGTIIPFFGDRTNGLTKKVVNFKEWYGIERDWVNLAIKT